MNAKWPFIVLVLGLFFLLGYIIMRMDRKGVMSNWAKRRCDLSVMFAAGFFKPDSDPRTTSDFATENFEFCMKSFVDSFLELFMAPINAVFGKFTNNAGSAMGALNSVRNIAQVLYNSFAAYVKRFFMQFQSTFTEVGATIEQLKMAVGRISAIAMSMIYTGLTMWRGMINFIQAVIRAVLIICAIMLGIIIILWFILFPVIPLILTTLTAVVTVVMVMAGILDASIAADASSKKGGFCFAEDTNVVLQDGTTKPVQDIKMGDILQGNARVTTVIHMEGKDIPLYNLKGIFVSGSHLVKGEDNEWRAVAEDKRAVLTDRESEILYCFNTTTNNIPIQSEEGVILFRDWEEIDNEDVNGQYIWNYIVSNMLNKGTSYTEWKQNLTLYCECALVGKSVEVKTQRGFIPISELGLSDFILDEEGNEQVIRGMIYGEVEGYTEAVDTWLSELYVRGENGIWKRSRSTITPVSCPSQYEGMSLMTDRGVMVIRDPITKQEMIVRDFTEVGYQAIHETYPFVEARLRMTERSHKII